MDEAIRMAAAERHLKREMKAVDSNVLVRYMLGDDKEQAKRASPVFNPGMLRRIMPCFVNRIVSCELVWVFERVIRSTLAEIVSLMLVEANANHITGRSKIGTRLRQPCRNTGMVLILPICSWLDSISDAGM